MHTYIELSTPQKNIYNLQKYYEKTVIANLCGAVFFQEERDVELIRKAINFVIKKQTALRLQFVTKDGEIKQYVKEYSHIDIPNHKFVDDKAIETYAKELVAQPIGLEEDDMYRFEIVSVGKKTGILVVLSHLISDAWTFSLLVKEIDEIYQDLLVGKEIADDCMDYRKYVQSEIEYFNSSRFEKDKVYWQEKYNLKPESSPIKTGTGVTDSILAKRLIRRMSAKLTRKIQNYCMEQNITPAVFLETALYSYLFKINPDNQTITLGLPVLNRTKKYEKRTAGMFISTVPLTVELSEEDTVLQLIEKITEAHMQAFHHQRYPYSMILKNLREKQNFEGNLYDVMFSFQNARTEVNADTKWYSNGYSEVPFTLHVDNRDNSDTYTLTVDYQVELFREDSEVNAIIDRLEHILEQIVENDSVLVKDISIVPDDEKQRILFDFNDTKVDYPRDKCVHELFMEQAGKTPDAIAVVFEDKEISYRELDEMSNVLAYVLQEKGVERGDVVPLIAKRSYYILVAMLGILKAGGAYMPVAPDYPKDRIQFIVQEAKSKVACVLGYKEELGGIELLQLDELSLENAEEDKKCLVENQNQAEDMCYVIFTSGSTGLPKGIALAHKTITNLVFWQQLSGVLDESKRILSFTSIIFDVFTQEVFSAILNGLTLLVINDEVKNNINGFREYVRVSNADTLYCTPSYYNAVTHEGKLDVNKVILAGEEFIVNKNVRESGITYYNQYGPAETHVVSCVQVKNFESITIGKPIANTQIYILDRHGKPVPIGVPGELCIAGDGVGMGYLNRPDLTTERFVPNPFATEENGHGKTLYHTGDLAAWRENGDIEYLGRIDTQVKIRGLRIELGEIESVMAEFRGIRMCAVTDKKDEDGRQYLVGYYTTGSDEKEHKNIMTAVKINEKELRQHLLAKLPKYMVPNYFMHLDKLPMTPSGKTDRKNLPVPEIENCNEEELTFPQNDIEEKILAIWKNELHMERLGCNQDFFEVGGDSLLAIALLTQLEKEFGVHLQMQDVFENRTVEKQAIRISGHFETRESIVCAKNDKFPLTPQQKALYLASQKLPDTLLYNMPAYIPLPDTVNRDRLVEAINKVFNDFQILRMKVRQEQSGLFGVIDYTCRLCIEHFDEDDKENFVRPFDLMQAPLFRIGFTDKYLLIDMHHIISDGMSLQILIKAVQIAYEKNKSIQEMVGYSDYAEYLARYLKSEKVEQGLQWYRDNLMSASETVTFPKARKKSAYEGENYYYQLSKELRIKEREVCGRYQITETMLYVAAYALLLKSYSGLESVPGSMVVTNRQHFEIENTLGMFVNTLPIVWSFEKRYTVEEYLKLCKEKLLRLYEYEEIPFETIIEKVENVDATVFNTSFVYQANIASCLELEGQTIVPEYVDTHSSKFDLTVEVTPNEEGDYLRLEYRTDKVDRALAQRMAKSYEQILLQLVEKETIDEITALTKEDEQRILLDFNDTVVDYDRDKCIHELFMEQAMKTPNELAVVFEDKKFTYRELDEMSNVLARLLKEKGVRRGEIIPIIAKRSYYILIAMFGILKSGGAYMPISPDYPKERVQFIVNEAKSKIGCVLGYEEELEDIELLQLDELSLENAEEDKKCPVENQNQAEDVCYVIFTSGSTGLPKGVMITHGNVTNYSNNNNNNNVCHAIIKKEYKKIISVTNIVFDIFVTESVLPLLNGITVYFTNDEEVFSQSAINRIVTENAIEVLQTTPTKMKGYLFDNAQKEYLSTLKVIILGGEALTTGLYEELRKQTTAEIFNIYGPAETTVWSSNAKVENTDITIGKPIANTQIYILDGHGNPVPIGVPGELCIAGDGVGKGYLNRPDLTAERFVPNPFATEENGHGKTMYHTGDLAAWRENGDIEYLGRIDMQVKIRGLRIELGEIESVMSEFPGIRMCAVTDKKDEEGRQYLVGYYTTASDEKENQNIMTAVHIDEKELRRHLSAKLPKYMVPNYFMHLDKLPMTPSGKTDRKNLPVPQVIKNDSTEYVTPVTDTEKKLCLAMEAVLNYSPIGLKHDFFEYGGDSLKAMELIIKLEEYGYRASLQDIFEHPNVLELVQKLQNKESEDIHIEYLSERFEKYAPLLERNRIRDKYCMEAVSIKTVLLSGITGFLGVHIADALLQDEDCIVYCLVRSKNTEDRRGRLSEILEYYFGDKYKECIGTRIIPLVGDITNESLSDELPEKVDMVIHAAATVKHYGAYDYFYKVNTLGTKHMVDYARRVGAKFIHISTISVSGNSLADSFDTEVAQEAREFCEDCLYQEQDLKNVYVRSKFEAECVVLDAMLQGLQANIIRVGNLTNRSRDYVFQPNYVENAFLNRIKAALELRSLPDYLLPLYTEFSPVDDTAEAIVKIARHFHVEHTVYHVYSNQNLYFDRLLEILKKLGTPMSVVTGEEFTERIKATAGKEGSHIYEAFMNDMSEDGKLQYETNIHIQSDFTIDYLKQLGFEWTKIDLEYVKGYIEYFKRLGYLEV